MIQLDPTLGNFQDPTHLRADSPILPLLPPGDRLVEKEYLGLVDALHIIVNTNKNTNTKKNKYKYKYKYKYLEKEDLGLVDVPRPVELRPHDP